VENLWKRGTSPWLGLAIGVLFGALLSAYLFITGILDVTSSGYGAAAMLAQALPRAAKDLVPWLLIWLFITPAVQRIPFGRPWIALFVSAALGVALAPRLLGIEGLSATQRAAMFLFGLILTLPVVRARDVWMPSAFFIGLHVVTVSIMGMPFGSIGEGIFASRLVGDELVTGGTMGPVFSFAGMLGQLWIGGAMLQHQRLVFSGARARVQSRSDGLEQLAIGLMLGGAGAAVMFVLTLLFHQSKIAGVDISLAPISGALTTALPVAIASVVISCLVLTSLVSLVIRSPWIAALAATIIVAAWQWRSPGGTGHVVAGSAVLTLALTLAFAKTGRLWLPIGIAYGWLLFEGPIFGFPTNGFPIGHPWFSQQVLEYTVWGGGIAGPAASVFATAAKCLVVVGVILLTRSEKFQGA
jgi:hypothetical protein